jgi:hypothetical protein
MRHTLSVFGLAALILAALATPLAPTVLAQRATPTPGGLSLEMLKRYGTKLALPMVPGTGAAGSASLALTNVGWEPTGVLVVALGAAPPGGCPTTQSAPIVAHSCQALVPPLAVNQLALPGSGARSALVYTLKGSTAAASCAAFEAVAAGTGTLADWEKTAWTPGEAVAALLTAQDGSAATGFTAEPSASNAGIANAGGDRPGRPGGAGSFVLPSVWPGSAGGHAMLMNVVTNCLTVNGRVGLGMTDSCSTPQTLQAQLPPLSSGMLSLPDQANGPAAFAGQFQGEVIPAASRQNASGWLSYSGASASNQVGGVAFPLAIGPVPSTQAELLVTNMNVTATANVELVMFDGNRGLHKLYTDPVPLCAAGTRAYDITALAGEIPATMPGRGGAAGPPMLSLRLQGTTSQLPQAPLLAGVMVMQNAYGGLANSAATNVMQALRRQNQYIESWTVVPGVKKKAGPDRRSTLLAIQVIGNPQAENQALVDFYDAAGTKVNTQDLAVGLGDGPAGFVDLANLPPRLQVPDGFVGTAVVRGQQNRGTLTVVALERAEAAPAGDTLVSWTGVILPRFPNPNAPTVTPSPTRDPSLPTRTPNPTRDVSTPTPTGGAATATPTATCFPDGCGGLTYLYLPFANRYRAGAAALWARGR